MANINGLIVKRILVDTKSSYNVIIFEAVKGLQIDLTKLKKDTTPLASIREKLVNVYGRAVLPTTLGDQTHKRTVRQSFMIANIDAPDNVFLEKPLFNELSAIMSLKYLLIKLEIEKSIAFVRWN